MIATVQGGISKRTWINIKYIFLSEVRQSEEASVWLQLCNPLEKAKLLRE